MGRRHGAADPTSTHGRCPSPWCPYCSYLELKANHVGVGYGRLSIDQLRAHALARHAIHLPGWYAEIQLVSASSYSATVAAKGRSDDSRGGRFRHSIAVWAVGQTAPSGRPATYIVSDPDFGSPARPRMPPFCEYPANQVESFYRAGGLRLTYCLTAPPPLGADGRAIAITAPGVTYEFGGQPRGRGLYVATPAEGARQRQSPYIRAGNVIQTVPKGSRFQVLQTTVAGTNVGGSSTWHGDSSGQVWMHESVVEPIG